MSRKCSEVSCLEIAPVREAFAHEAYDFTTWLEANIEVLSERIGLDLSVVGREYKVGDFIVDLLCEDHESNKVIIENQLERTDHSHLGQILTYLVGFGASHVIWITTEPRREHQRVMEWLSGVSSVNFYLVKIEAVRIGDSPYAPLFSVLVGPDYQAKEIGKEKKEWRLSHHNRYEFWEGLLSKCSLQTKLFTNTSPRPSVSVSMGAGLKGVKFKFGVSQVGGTVELYIDHEKEDGGIKNKLMLKALEKHRGEIQKSFGGPLDWESFADRRAVRIRRRIEGEPFGSLKDREVLQGQMIEAMAKLYEALGPFLDLLKKV